LAILSVAHTMPASIFTRRSGTSPDKYIIKLFLFLAFLTGVYSAGVFAADKPCKPRLHQITGAPMPCPDTSTTSPMKASAGDADSPVNKGPASIPTMSQPETNPAIAKPAQQAAPPCKLKPHPVTGILMPCPN
jgi:hypothetical protein